MLVFLIWFFIKDVVIVVVFKWLLWWIKIILLIIFKFKLVGRLLGVVVVVCGVVDVGVVLLIWLWVFKLIIIWLYFGLFKKLLMVNCKVCGVFWVVWLVNLFCVIINKLGLFFKLLIVVLVMDMLMLVFLILFCNKEVFIVDDFILVL